jgi:hypothetical protein
MHRAKPLVQLDEILTVLEALEQVSLGTLLAMCQRLEDAMPLEQARDLVETLLKTGLGTCHCHRGGLPVLQSDDRPSDTAASGRDANSV